MASTFSDRLKHAWNAFMNRDPPFEYIPETYDYGYSSSIKPDRVRLSCRNERSIIAAIYNRIAMDCAAIKLQHVRLDENGRYSEEIKDGLNNCLTLEANKDQTSRAFIQDAIMSMFDEGCVALVPVDTTFDPRLSSSYDINTLRTGKIIQWYPDHVKLRVYNDRVGKHEEITLPKAAVAIVENPLYAIMNEQNSTLQRLIRKLNLLDIADEQNSSGKLDLIVQLPYTIKSDARKEQAEARRKSIEGQLVGSKYGIAYIDSTEHITQLNRAVENNLLEQVNRLTELLYSQLGITTTILDGTADEKTMLNYYSRTIEPILSALADEMKRKFLTKTARSQNQSIEFFRDPFRLVPVNDIAEIADKFTRNEIMSSNELRTVIGMKPIDNPKADELRNKNLNAMDGQSFATTNGQEIVEQPATDKTEGSKETLRNLPISSIE